MSEGELPRQSNVTALPVRATLSVSGDILDVTVVVRDRVGLTGANLVITSQAGDLVLSLGAAQAAYLAGVLAQRSGVVFGG